MTVGDVYGLAPGLPATAAIGTAVMTASKPDDLSSTPDELLGIGPREARDRRLALFAHLRWESEGGALLGLSHERGDGAVAGDVQEVRRAQ